MTFAWGRVLADGLIASFFTHDIAEIGGVELQLSPRPLPLT